MHPQWACTLRENRLRRHLEEGDDLRALSAATAASARLPARCQPSCSGGGQIGGGRRGRVRPALAGRTAAARELLGALIAHSSDDHQRVLRVPQQLQIEAGGVSTLRVEWRRQAGGCGLAVGETVILMSPPFYPY